MPSDVIIEGTLNGVPCALLARHGRKHQFQPSDVNYRANIWALKLVGCTHILATTATGSLNEAYKPGQFVVVDDFIDKTWGRNGTFYDSTPGGPRGVCHVPMYPAMCQASREALIQAAKKLNHDHHEKGTCLVIQGPRFSTRAESLMHIQWGCDIVNMTLAPEAQLAKEAGLSYAALALVTDYDSWMDSSVVNVEEVLAMLRVNVQKMAKVIIEAIGLLSQKDDHSYLDKLKKTVEGAVML